MTRAASPRSTPTAFGSREPGTNAAGSGAIRSSTSVDTKYRSARSRVTDNRTGTVPAGNARDQRMSNGCDCLASLISPVPGRSGSSTQVKPVRT